MGTLPRSVAVGDFNGDGKPDLTVANQDADTVSVLLGNGDGSFQAPRTFAVGSVPFSVAVGDFNGDGKPDLTVANENVATVSVLLGNGDGSFQAQRTFAVGSTPISVAVGDFNGDGKPDLTVANDGANTVSVLLGNGDGSFQAQRTFAVGTAPLSVAVGDFDRDGMPDLVTANSAGTPPGVPDPFNTDNSASVLLNTATAVGGSQAAAGSVLIDQLRLAGPGGAGDQLVDLYNRSATPVSVGGWVLEGSTGGSSTIPLGTVIPGSGHLALTGLPGAYSLCVLCRLEP